MLFFLLIAAPARANVFTVGNGCPYTSITSAIADAETNPGPDTIQLSYNRQYDQQAISISTAQQLDIVGGFPDCGQSANDGTHAEISGLSQPVFRITVETGGVVTLSYVTIQGGNAQGLNRGGGIYFKGNGTLELHHASISQNTAGFGGGIYAEATGDSTKLVIGEDVAIVGNTARYDGAGVVNDSAR
jgi:predicted outer membrane repeat protein